MILTVELAPQDGVIDPEKIGEVAICCDDEGLEKLISYLESLRGRHDHQHLMTPAWAGNELTEEKHGDGHYVLVNHLRIVKI